LDLCEEEGVEMEGSSHRLHVHSLEFWGGDYHTHLAEVHPHRHVDSFLLPALRLLKAPRIPPHSARLFAVRPVKADRPQYLGSDVHFSCGMEVESFKWWKEERVKGGVVVVVDLVIDAGKVLATTHFVWLSLPGAKKLRPPVDAEKVGSGGVVVGGMSVWKITAPPGESRYFKIHVEYEADPSVTIGDP